MLAWLSEQVQNWGYYALFLMTFLETSAFLGLIAPGETVVVIAGFLAAQGILDLWHVLWVAALGALAGDHVGYLIGRRFGEGFILAHGERVFIRREYLEDTRAFFERYGGKTIFVGRFIGWLRAFGPVVAGTAHMSYPRFFFFDLYGTVLWALVFVLIGYLAGSSWALVKDYLGQVGVLAGALALLAVFGFVFLRRRRRMLRRQLGWLDRRMARLLPGLWPFAKDRFRVRTWYGLNLTIGLVLLVLAVGALSQIVHDLAERDTLFRLDARVQALVEYLITPEVTAFMVGVADVGGIFITVATAAFLIVWLARRHAHWTTVVLILALLLGAIAFGLLRLSLQAAGLTGPQFPSGHAYAAVLVYGMLAHVAWTGFRGEVVRFIAYSFATVMVLLIGFSQIYLRVHWTTDVLAGYAAGLAWLVFSILLGGTLRALYEPQGNREAPR